MHDRSWYERRLTGFGASEAPALLGISRWKTARDVVEDKGRRVIPDPDAPERIRLRLGREMEPILAKHALEVAQERGLEVAAGRLWQPAKLYRMPGAPFVITNVDRFLGAALLELKTDEYGYEPWGDDLDDSLPWQRKVPAVYAAQVQHALAATGRDRALLFVMIGLHERRLYEIPRDDDFIFDHVEVLEPLWQSVIEIRARLDQDPDAEIDDLLPPIDASPRSTEWLRKRYPVNDGLVLSATAEQNAVISALRSALADVKSAEQRAELLKNRLREWIGPHDGISGPSGTVTNRKPKDSIIVKHDAIAAALRKLIERTAETAGEHVFDVALYETGFIEARLSEALDVVAGLHTETRENSRVLRTPAAWSKAGAE